MYEVEFYRDQNGKSEIVDYLDELEERGRTSKHERVNLNKILSYIISLKQYGTRIGYPVVKHIDGKLWELRTVTNRIFFFYWKDNKFIMLHYFIKKTRKTPVKEIETARQKLNDFLERYGE